MSCSNCKLQAYDYANQQNTVYDAKNNEILYGINNHMKASGVSDGTCNQINPLMLRYSARCGVGAAGGNPCYPNSVEPFESAFHGCNISGFVTMLFLILILLLFINISYFENKQLSTK
jgi:hypothetical protein